MSSAMLQSTIKKTCLQVLSINLVRRFSLKNKNIIKSACTDVEIPNVTIPQFVFENFHRFPQKIAVECSVTGRNYTYEEIKEKSRNLGNGLRKILKVRDGDVLAILLPNMPEFPIAVLGSLEANLVVTCINPAFTPGEIKNQLMDSNPKVIITLSELCPSLHTVIAEIKRTIPIICVKSQPTETTPENAINFNELVSNNFDIEKLKPKSTNSTAFLLYSSGTTGLPKGVNLSHNNIIANLCQMDHSFFKITYETTENHQDVAQGILPWYHIAGLNTIMLLYLRYLCKLIAMPKFTPEQFVSTLVKHKPQLLLVVPPVVSFMCNHPVIKKEYFQSVRVIVSGAAPLGALEEEKMQNKTDDRVEILQGYGLTETSPFVLAASFKRKKQLSFKGSVGEVIPNTVVKVVPVDNPEGEPLGPNESGELLVKGPQVTLGYHNKPQETTNSFLDGWLRTGDLVYYDENKMFYVQDRLKELIKVKGFQVAPAELEDLIKNYPGVDDAAVIGISNERYGEVPHAFIVLKPDAKINVKDLKSYVSNNVVEYKAIQGVTIVDSIPKNPSGKTLRRQLKLKYGLSNASR